MNEQEQAEYKQFLQTSHGFTPEEADEYLQLHSPKEQSLAGKVASAVGRGLDYIPGMTRTALQKGADVVTGGDAAGTFEQAASAEAQPWEQYLEKRDVLSQDVKPFMPSLVRNLAGMAGKEEIPARSVAGPLMDVASDPTLIGSMMTRAPLTGIKKAGEVMMKLQPVGVAEKILQGGSYATKAAGRALSGLSKSEAEAFVKNPKSVYGMAEKISNPETVGEVQRTASEQLAPAIKSLGSKRIDPLMAKVDELTAGKELPVETSKILQMMEHDPELSSMGERILKRGQPYGQMETTKPTIMAPASDLNAMKRRGYDVAEYKTNRSAAQMPSSKDAELAPLNRYLKEVVEGASPEIATTNAEIRRLNILRERANQLAANPLNPFSTESLDQMAVLSELAKEADAPALLQFRNELKAARSVVGKDAAKNMSHGSLKHSAIAGASRKLGRGLLLAEEAAPLSKLLGIGKEAASKIPASKQLQQIPPEMWSKILEVASEKE